LKIEHTAYQVEDPIAVARWYVTHLGMALKRSFAESPFGQFIADDGGAVMLEFYNNPKVAVPDYRLINPLVLHIAFTTDDVAATRERLLAAGATSEGDIQTTDFGDEMAMLRDPWGLPVQLVRRKAPMIP
jgi:glyoxylase I family protein